MDRNDITFEQAEGTRPLPQQLELRTISPEMRAILYSLLHDSVTLDPYSNYISDPWLNVLRDLHVYHEYRMVDEFNGYWTAKRSEIKAIFLSGTYAHVLGYLEFLIRHPKTPETFAENVDAVLIHCKAAYRVIDGHTIAPIASSEEKEAIERAFRDVSDFGFRGAREHLRKAAASATQGNWADSVRESIHAVESVARKLESGADTLEPALKKLEAKGAIHGGLRRGFGAIYGYASDEKGIRHSLIEDSNAKVDETDALFMLGACASFVSYLINKGRAAGLLST